MADDAYLTDPPPPTDGSWCAFPNCDCEGDEPLCEDYLTTSPTRRLERLAAGEPCPVHHVSEPCPSCEAILGLPS